VRTASDQPYRLQMFKIRMVYASDVRNQDLEVILEPSGMCCRLVNACCQVLDDDHACVGAGCG
jgi:hypothetical protein